MNVSKLNQIAELIGGKAWGAANGKPRIYFQSAKDRKVFFSFPDFDGTELGGARLDVFIDDSGQPANWYASQKQRENERLYAAALAIQAFEFDEAKAAAIMELDEVTPEMLDAASHEFANGRAAEGFAVLGLVG